MIDLNEMERIARYAARKWGLCQSMQMDDARQEAMAAMLAAQSAYADGDQTEGEWLMTVAKHRLLHLCDRRYNGELPSADAGAHLWLVASSNPEQEIGTRELAARLAAKLERLIDTRRAWLVIVEEERPAQVAAADGVPVAQVYSEVRRVRRHRLGPVLAQLRKEIEGSEP